MIKINEEEMFNAHYIKDKQWYRTGRNHINQIVGSSGKYGDNYGIIKITDTPQELIQVGDLVFVLYEGIVKHYIIQEITKDDCYICDNGNVVISGLGCITKILTPNSCGGYNLQWEDHNGKT